jgi:hypothetical protein
MHIVGVRGLSKFHVDQSAAPEVNAQRDAVPEQHGKNPGHAEYQREGEEVPLLPEKIDVRTAKEFQSYLILLLLMSRRG